MQPISGRGAKEGRHRLGREGVLLPRHRLLPRLPARTKADCDQGHVEYSAWKKAFGAHQTLANIVLDSYALVPSHSAARVNWLSPAEL